MENNDNKKKDAIYEYIFNFSKDNGYSPSVREIQKAFKFKSTSTVSYYMEKLKQSGLISMYEGKNRAINFGTHAEILHAEDFTAIEELNTNSITEIASNDKDVSQTIHLPKSLFDDENLLIMTFNGESMINSGIQHGDKVIIRRQDDAKNGDIIAVILDDHITIRKYYRDLDNRIQLDADNNFISATYYDDIQIMGVIIGIIRHF